MNSFNYYIPTKVYFGKGQIEHINELTESGEKVLFVYGKGSVKSTALYDTVMRLLYDKGINVHELSGIEPNPKIDTVRKGVAICKENGIQMVLAVGGGSVIDSAKLIAAGAMYEGDPWDIILDGKKIKTALPIYVVLTVAATGSEMDPYSVINDPSQDEKKSTASEHIRPKMAIMDPEYTYSVSRKQTAAGTADILSHTLENYFTNVKGATLQHNMCEAVMKTIIQYGPVAIRTPYDYDARANLMWCSSLAINGLLDDGAEVMWCVHAMEHELSAYYDVVHGEGLAVLTPVWMEFVLGKEPQKQSFFADYGKNVWGLTDEDEETLARKAIILTKDFLFNKMQIPCTLREIGVKDKDNFRIMARRAASRCVGSFVELTEDDIVTIYDMAF